MRLMLACLLVQACMAAEPKPAESILIESATYVLNRPGYHGIGHAFHVDALPGYLISAAHIFEGLPDQDYDAEPGHGRHLTVRVAHLDATHDVAILRIVRGKPPWSIPLGGVPKHVAPCWIVHGNGEDPRMDRPCAMAGHDKSGTRFFVTQKPYPGLSGAVGIQGGKAVFMVLRKGVGTEENPGTEGVSGQTIQAVIALFGSDVEDGSEVEDVREKPTDDQARQGR